jgi:CRISPR-associated protein Cas2
VARKNRYRGVLRPLQVGRGSPETSLVLIYDVEEDRIRTRVADICLDYGLERIQFSAFFGRLNRNRRQELSLRVQAEIGDQSARVRVVPVCEDDLKDMWIFDQYRRTGDDLKPMESETGRKPELPRLRVLGSEET